MVFVQIVQRSYLGNNMKNCIMCNQLFEEKDLDWIGRCEPCFRKYMLLKDTDLKPDLGIPYTPISKAEK
jgi:hypothetical protein